jgi:hypothetical protein
MVDEVQSELTRKAWCMLIPKIATSTKSPNTLHEFYALLSQCGCPAETQKVVVRQVLAARKKSNCIAVAYATFPLVFVGLYWILVALEGEPFREDSRSSASINDLLVYLAMWLGLNWLFSIVRYVRGVISNLRCDLESPR